MRRFQLIFMCKKRLLTRPQMFQSLMKEFKLKGTTGRYTVVSKEKTYFISCLLFKPGGEVYSVVRHLEPTKHEPCSLFYKTCDYLVAKTPILPPSVSRRIWGHPVTIGDDQYIASKTVGMEDTRLLSSVKLN